MNKDSRIRATVQTIDDAGRYWIRLANCQFHMASPGSRMVMFDTRADVDSAAERINARTPKTEG